MFEWIPLQSYSLVHYCFCFIVIMIIILYSKIYNLEDKKNLQNLNILGYIFLGYLVLYIGMRPVNEVFIDMPSYKKIFLRFLKGTQTIDKGDVLFLYMTKLSTKIISVEIYFFFLACLYILPLYIVCKKWFKKGWFYGLIFFVVILTFWNYGVNGMRNGIAGSLFLLGISREKRLWQIFWIIISINFHQSMLLPTFAFILANFINKPKWMIGVWLSCIPLSILGGGIWETFFANLGFGDDRLSYLTKEVTDGKFSGTGFRWDFLLYSSTAVIAGWYYIFKCKFRDKIYFWLFNTYVLSNAFWILVIRANFSNRFAYLSWFMMALVIIYPLLKKYILPKQYQIITYILLGFFCFTFFMNVLR